MESKTSLTVRLQLGEALRTEGHFDAALEQFVAVLALDPTNEIALRGAADVCDALGDERRGESYRRLLEALGLAPAPAEQPDQRKAERGWTRARAGLQLVSDGEEQTLPWQDERATITLDDVAGMDPVKRRLQVAFLGPLRNPELRLLYGKSLRGGLLLYGPPGCGKTFIARATAGEMGAKFLSVGISDVLDMWLGESERKLHELFENARRSAPAVLFFDEVDAIGQ
jgi:tetratricopeptide (TPR) repeat protein